ncbi:MAG: hypothetical protein QXG10_00020 [Candidatus Hadarchaeales archaeon]
MDEGSIELFMGAKLAVAFASMLLIGTALSWGNVIARDISLDELNSVADAISGSIADVQTMPSCSAVMRSIPRPAQSFTVEVTEERGGIARVAVVGRCRVERFVPLNTHLSGDRAENPAFVELIMDGSVKLRLIE